MVSRAKRSWAIAGVSALAIAAVGIAGFAVVRPLTPSPVSSKVVEYYESPQEAAKIPGPMKIEWPESGPLKVVFAGDSLTYGLYASSEAKGYRPQVVAALEKGGPVTASRGGQTGNTVKTVADSITFPADTGLIVLALGTNDVFKTEVPDFAKHYASVAEKARKSAPGAVIVCAGVWSNVDGARNYDPPIQSACESNGGRFVRINDIFDAANNRGPAGRRAFGGTSDLFHPNDNGYKAIADRILEVITV